MPLGQNISGMNLVMMIPNRAHCRSLSWYKNKVNRRKVAQQNMEVAGWRLNRFWINGLHIRSKRTERESPGRGETDGVWS